MNMEEYAMRRLFCIAQMAATLEAGDRANPTPGSLPDVADYAQRASALFDAADALDAARFTPDNATEI